MRTAVTIARTGKGWVLISGPDVSADKQRSAFDNLGREWPEGIIEVRFQQNDGVSKCRDQAKAESIAVNTSEADKKSAAKEELQKKQAAEVVKAREAEQVRASKEHEKRLADQLAIKHARNNPPTAPKIEVPKK